MFFFSNKKAQKDENNIPNMPPPPLQQCCHCKKTGYLKSSGMLSINNGRYRLITQCSECGEITIFKATYFYKTWLYSEVPMSYPLEMPDLTIFPEEIKNISPKFVEIYNQSKVAEFQSLLEIAGPGYRKALEFLVKDYCKKETNIKNVEKTALKNLIQKFPNDDIDSIGKLTVELGNDEVHYYRQLKDRDLKTIRESIGIMANYLFWKIKAKESKERTNETN